VITGPDTQARNRFIVLSAIRMSGAVMLVLGLVIIAGRLGDMPPIAGYILIAVGIAEFIVVPPILARKWRSPGE
jgi:hypothetical protein